MARRRTHKPARAQPGADCPPGPRDSWLLEDSLPPGVLDTDSAQTPSEVTAPTPWHESPQPRMHPVGPSSREAGPGVRVTRTKLGPPCAHQEVTGTCELHPGLLQCLLPGARRTAGLATQTAQPVGSAPPLLPLPHALPPRPWWPQPHGRWAALTRTRVPLLHSPSAGAPGCGAACPSPTGTGTHGAPRDAAPWQARSLPGRPDAPALVHTPARCGTGRTSALSSVPHSPAPRGVGAAWGAARPAGLETGPCVVWGPSSRGPCGSHTGTEPGSRFPPRPGGQAWDRVLEQTGRAGDAGSHRTAPFPGTSPGRPARTQAFPTGPGHTRHPRSTSGQKPARQRGSVGSNIHVYWKATRGYTAQAESLSWKRGGGRSKDTLTGSAGCPPRVHVPGL